MYKNTVEPERPQMVIWRMCTAYWIPEATNTYSKYVILLTFPLQQWMQEGAQFLLHCLSCLTNIWADFRVLEYAVLQQTYQYDSAVLDSWYNVVTQTVSINFFYNHGSRHDVADIATSYRLTVRISNSSKVIACSPKPSRSELGPIQPSIQWVPWTFPENEEAGA